MKVLLDTHAVLWYVLADARLTETAKSLILDSDKEAIVSAATYWEIAIKVSIGKIELNQPYEKFIDACLSHYGFETLPIKPAHTTMVASMTFEQNHRDPFDRLLVAQALVENMPIVSADGVFDRYGVRRLW